VKLWPERKRRPIEWELKITSPEGELLHLTTGEALEIVWRFGDRSTDGYVDILQMPRVNLWVRPSGHVEPDRAALLDGTAALPDGMRRHP
jgi:hypothetical protein